MEPGGLMLHSQELSNNSYPEPNQPKSLYRIPQILANNSVIRKCKLIY